MSGVPTTILQVRAAKIADEIFAICADATPGELSQHQLVTAVILRELNAKHCRPADSDDLLGVLNPVLDWYQSEEQPKRQPLHIVADIVADLQNDRASALRMSAALRKIVNEFDALNGTECARGCGTCIRCLALAALDTPNDGTQRPGSPDVSLATESRKPGSLE